MALGESIHNTPEPYREAIITAIRELLECLNDYSPPLGSVYEGCLLKGWEEILGTMLYGPIEQ